MESTPPTTMPNSAVSLDDEPPAGDAAPPPPPPPPPPSAVPAEVSAPAASDTPATAAPAAQRSRSSASACTLVIKSLPFSLTVPAITAAIGSRVPVPPSSVAPVRDHQGVFRGTAFVAFPSVADADSAAEALAGVQLVGTRRLVVERVREREPASAAAREKELRRAALAKGVPAETVDALEAFVVSFLRGRAAAGGAGAAAAAAHDAPPTAGVVERPLSSAERRYVHARAGSLGLDHVTVPWGDAEDDRSVRVAVKAAAAGPSSTAPADGDGAAADGDGAAAEVAAMATANSKKGKKKKAKAEEKEAAAAAAEAALPPLVKGRPDVMALARSHKLSGPNESYVAPVKGEVRAEDLKGIKFFRPRAAAASASAAAAGATGGGAAVKAAPPVVASAAAPDGAPATAAPGVPTGGGGGGGGDAAGPDGLLVHGGLRQWYAPPRQPAGPDGTLGFHAARKAAEAALEGMALAGGAGEGVDRGGSSDVVGGGPEAGAAAAGGGDGNDA